MKLVRHAVLPAAAALAALFAPSAFATVYGTIVSSTPVYAQTNIPQRVCTDEPVTVQQRPSGAGAVAGAIVGGAVGNAFGAGQGRAAATALGVVLGATVGDRAEAQSLPPATATARRCRTVSQSEDRVVGYDVVYDYSGVRRTARLAQDPGAPGERIALDVAPAGAVASNRPGRVGQAVPPPGARRAVPRPDDEVIEQDDAEYAAAPPRVVYAAPYPYYVAAPGYYAPPPAYYGYPYPAATVWIGGTWHGHRHWR
jgi:uncharacterized protein YcfJ